MVQTYGPLTEKDHVVPYLIRVAETLEKGDITLDEAKQELESVLAGPVLAACTDEERENLRVAYNRQYEQRDGARAAAQQLGNGQPDVGVGNPPPAGAGGRAAVGDPVGQIPNLDPGDILLFQAWKQAQQERAPESSAPKDRPTRPWHSLTAIEDDVALHPVVRQTRQLVREYAEDLDATKRDLLNTSRLPSLPDTVWRSILKDEFVDLDKIYSTYNSTVDTAKRSEKIADNLWLSTESDTPTKHITTSTDWLVTFRSYMRGVLVVFPHRKQEFETWEELVSTKFRVYNATMHKRIITLETASRRTIFDSNSLCLFSTQVLENLLPAWIATEGAEYTTVAGSSGSGDRPRKKLRTAGSASGPTTTRATCNNWNSKGCTYTGCRFRHVCSNCGGAHPKRDCTKTASA